MQLPETVRFAAKNIAAIALFAMTTMASAQQWQRPVLTVNPPATAANSVQTPVGLPVLPDLVFSYVTVDNATYPVGASAQSLLVNHVLTPAAVGANKEANPCAKPFTFPLQLIVKNIGHSDFVPKGSAQAVGVNIGPWGAAKDLIKLPPTASQTMNFSVTLPPGKYAIDANIDLHNGVAEARSDNNKLSWPLEVKCEMKAAAVMALPTPGPATGASGPQAPVAPHQLRETMAKSSNPHAANSAHASMIAALRTQKQAADSERSAILASQRIAPKGQAAAASTLTPGRTLGNPLATDPAAGTPPVGTPGVTPPTGPGATPPPGTPRGAPTSLASAGAATAVMKLPSSTLLPPAAAAPPSRSLAGLGVAQGPCTRPTIGTVNGVTQGAIFTPDPQYNLYTIKGCMFGDTQGQAHLYGGFAAGQGALQIEFWSDTQIVAKMDPQVTGELDQNNVTLVLVPSGAPQVQKAGFKFYAMRESTLLTKIPQSAVQLAQLTDTVGKPVFIQYATPGIGSSSAGVIREAENVFAGGHSDFFDFNKLKLKPGFTAESFTLQTWTLENNCGAKYKVNGIWEAYWNDDHTIRVSFPMQYCQWEINIPFIPLPVLSQTVARNSYSLSRYALSVWVNGPRGVSPWPN